MGAYMTCLSENEKTSCHRLCHMTLTCATIDCIHNNRKILRFWVIDGEMVLEMLLDISDKIQLIHSHSQDDLLWHFLVQSLDSRLARQL